MEDELSDMDVEAVVLGDVPHTFMTEAAGADVDSTEQIDICTISEISIGLSESLQLFSSRVGDHVAEDQILDFCW